MKVAKRFRWEGAHRLPWHTGGCQNLHGHSYVMWVELKGAADASGMVMDFKAIKQVLGPLVDSWDHSVLVAGSDLELIAAVKQLGSKYSLLPYDTTSENICLYVVEYLASHAFEVLQKHQIESVSVKVQETETCYGEYEASIKILEQLKFKAASKVEPAF